MDESIRNVLAGVTVMDAAELRPLDPEEAEEEEAERLATLGEKYGGKCSMGNSVIRIPQNVCREIPWTRLSCATPDEI